MANDKPKYTVTEHRGGVCSTHNCKNLGDIHSLIGYLMAGKGPGQSVNLTIEKNK